jgi:hypothetical protein
MAKHDARIWERFLAAYLGFFTDAAYDVALGGAETADPDATEADRLMWKWNTAKRIDAVVRNADEIWLCEVRPGAGLSAVGAVLGYTVLSEHDRWATLPIVPTIVTDHMDDDTKLVCRELEIQVVELPEPEPVEPIRGG